MDYESCWMEDEPKKIRFECLTCGNSTLFLKYRWCKVLYCSACGVGYMLTTFRVESCPACGSELRPILAFHTIASCKICQFRVEFLGRLGDPVILRESAYSLLFKRDDDPNVLGRMVILSRNLYDKIRPKVRKMTEGVKQKIREKMIAKWQDPGYRLSWQLGMIRAGRRVVLRDTGVEIQR